MSNTVRRTNNYFDGLRVTKQQIFLFVIIALAYFFEQLDNNNFAFIAPAMIKSGFLTKEKISLITSLYFLGMTLGGFLGGILSDLFGRRKTFLYAMLIFSTASVLNGMVTDFPLFVLARVTTGFGILMLMVTSMAYISEMSPAEGRGKWQSLINTGGFCAMPAIGFISRAIIPTGPEAWRIIFFFGALGYTSFLLGLKYLKESPRWLASKGRVSEAEKIIRELSGIDVDLSEAVKNIPPKVNVYEQFTGMLTRKYLKRTVILLLFGTLTTVVSFACAVWIPTLASLKGFSLEQSLSIGTAYMCGAPLGLMVVSFFADKGGRKIPLTVWIFFMAMMAFIYAHINVYIATLIMAILLNATLMGMSSMQTAYIPEHYPTKMRNTAVGTINAFYRLAVSLSQLFIPVIVSGYGEKGLFIILAVMLVLASIILLTFGERTGGISLELIE
ncbi:MFS transporter [Dehalobacter sp. DCM]|nr:MFS transporter [Dehalobacter sp. DCM]